MTPLAFAAPSLEKDDAVRVFVLGSSSEGNALLVEADDTRILVDAGIGPRVFAARWAALTGSDELPRVDAILGTHHHGDHFEHVGRLARLFGAKVHLHEGIEGRRIRRKFDVRPYVPGTPFRIGELEVRTERIPHDAPQVAVRVASRDHAVGIATDVGHVTPPLVGLLGECDAAFVEANYCSELLEFGPYPPSLKKRVSGGLGHLSNARTADLAQRLVGSRVGCMYLAHLSRTNNTPERALETVSRSARGMKVAVLDHSQPCSIGVSRVHPFQLGLFATA